MDAIDKRPDGTLIILHLFQRISQIFGPYPLHRCNLQTAHAAFVEWLKRRVSRPAAR